jgi:membrane-anchored protein YejM (alkaline phosphatase superfamily)
MTTLPSKNSTITMKKTTGLFVFIICATVSVLAVLPFLLGWLFERAGAFFRRVSWWLDVIANTVDEWGEGGDGDGGRAPPQSRRKAVARAALAPVFAFCLANAFLWSLLGVRFINSATQSFDPAGALFSSTAVTGHFGLLALALFLLLAPTRLLPKIPRSIIAVILASLVTAFLAADSVVHAQYKQHINLAYLQMFFSADGREIFVFPAGLKALFLTGAVLIAAAQAWLLFLCEKFPAGLRRLKIAAFVVILASAFVSNGLHAWADFTAHAPVLVRVEALPAFYPLTAKKLMSKLGFLPASSQKIPASGGTLNYPLRPLAPGSAHASRPNILFVVVDAWRADALSPETMPLLSKRAGTAIRFDRHVSGGNATRYGIFSLFYAIPPTYWNSFFAAGRRPVFMEILDALGYDFAIFASAGLQRPEFDRTVFAGIPGLRIKTAGKDVFERDQKAQDEFLHHCASRAPDTPFFGFLFYDVLHAAVLAENAEKPFRPTATAINYLALSNNTDPLPYYNLYKNAVFNLDRQFDALFVALERQDILRAC